MKKPSTKARLATDIVVAVFLIVTYLTGHADSHVHALFGFLLVAAVVVHAAQAHGKVVATTRNVAKKSMNRGARLDCLGLAMAVFLIAALLSGGVLMHMRMVEDLSFDEVAATPQGIVYICSAVLFLICAIVHIVLNRAGLDKLLPAKKA